MSSSMKNSHKYAADLTTTPALPTYNFPILKSDDIMLCLQQMDLPADLILGKPELAEPHKHRDKIKQVLVAVFAYCRGQATDWQQPTPRMRQAVATVEYPSLHQDFGDLRFYRAMRKLLATCGYPEFSMRDLHSPTAKRLRIQLSAIINFARFKVEQLELFREVLEPRQELLDRLQALNTENEMLNNELELQKQMSSEQQQQAHTLLQECQALEAQIAASNKQQATAREQAAVLKRRSNNLKDQIATSTWAWQEGQQEVERLRAQIAPDATRPVQEKKTLQTRLAEAKQQAATSQHTQHELQRQQHVVQRCWHDVTATASTLQQLQTVHHDYTTQQAQLATVENDITTQQRATSRLQDEIASAERALQRQHDKTVHARTLHATQLQATSATWHETQRHWQVLQQARDADVARVHAGEQEVDTLKANLAAAQTATMAQLATMQTQYQATERLFLTRSAARMQRLRMISSDDDE